MAKVLITPVKSDRCNVEPFELSGKLTSSYIDDIGLFYYIKGQSFSERLVTVLEEEIENENCLK